MNQIGGVFVFNNIGAAKKWKKIVVGLSYDQTNNNFNEFFVRDFTNSNSIDSFFLANAQGLRLDQISAFENESVTDAYVDIGNTFGYPHQQAFLGYESFIIEPDSFEDNNTSYTSNIAPGTFNQTYYSISRGYNGKLTANIGAQYSEKIYHNECACFIINVHPQLCPLLVAIRLKTVRLYTDYCMPKTGYLWTF